MEFLTRISVAFERFRSCIDLNLEHSQTKTRRNEKYKECNKTKKESKNNEQNAEVNGEPRREKKERYKSCHAHEKIKGHDRERKKT